jgi:hypothetical protein
VSGVLLALGLVVLPMGLAIAWTFTTCGCTGFIVAATGGSGRGSGGGSNALATAVSILVLLALCTATGGLLARRAVHAQRAAAPPDALPALYRHPGWAWALFTAIHLVLTIAYAAAGGALIVHLIAGLMD